MILLKKFFTLICILCTFLIISGCSNTTTDHEEKVFNYGTTAYGVEMHNTGLNPHSDYSGWSAVRYGVGETLFKFNEKMELEPWLAKSYEQLDDYTIKITLKDNIKFSSGRALDGQSVKECLEDLIKNHDRAPNDLKIEQITADGQTVTIKSREKVPALLNYLSDPYGAIIDMQYGVTEDRNVAGTGPFIATKISDTEINLEKNPNYWNGPVNMDKVNVKEIIDGDTLTMAMQAGEFDAVQGLPYASLSLFKDNPKFKISSTNTSRVFFAQLNLENPILQDINVRKAIAMGINKQGFTDNLLNGNGTPAIGAFPSNFSFGNETVTTTGYNPDEAKHLLALSGWLDTDGDGYVDKNGQKLIIRWLTYPGRQELPLLAETVQASLKEIGIDIKVNNTANQQNFLDNGDWDIYASAFVTAPTEDPEYFFTTHCLSNSAKNRGHYFNPQLEQLANELHQEFNPTKRTELAIKMQQILLDDYSFIFASHLKMSFVMKNNVVGFTAHPSDYYEITADLNYE